LQIEVAVSMPSLTCRFLTIIHQAGIACPRIHSQDCKKRKGVMD
jgi:hypothetical protein